MQITSITRTLALAGFAPAGKPANRQERFCSTRNSAKGSGKRAYAVLVLCAATAIALPAQTFTTLVSFDGTDGNTAFGLAGLVQATNGDLYGTTYLGGANFVCCGENGGGTVFRITPNGTLTTLYSFCPQSGCTDGAGANPNAGLVQATNGDFYGTTVNGGANGGGTVFKMTPGGSLTTLYSFCSEPNCTDGSFSNGLVQAANGDLYGTASSGGASNAGTVFKINPEWHADDAIQLLLPKRVHGRVQPLRGPGPGRQCGPLRDS
jgi:uncharacterized repeat protein (TIGR03803 family)